MWVRWVEKKSPWGDEVKWKDESSGVKEKEFLWEEHATSTKETNSSTTLNPLDHNHLTIVARRRSSSSILLTFSHIQPVRLIFFPLFLLCAGMKRWTGYCIEWWTRNFNELHRRVRLSPSIDMMMMKWWWLEAIFYFPTNPSTGRRVDDVRQSYKIASTWNGNLSIKID